jgi:uncharacterized Ntn-hydrolase superfamily protein
MKLFRVLILAIALPGLSYAQDTFSICAYDSLTGQLGSAGATCITAATSAVIISDVVPGKGVVHTQASWTQANKNYAHSMLLLGLPPQQIIDSVTLHDAGNNSTIRQYGVVDVNGNSAGFTGLNCMNYKNHVTGPGYSIQGNILLGQQILDSMESRFLNTPGTLACRLMAAMQGAKVVGADTRCTSLGISSVSAFIRVANPGDTGTTPFHLNITLNTYPNYTEPIDSLQERFDLWGGCNYQTGIQSTDGGKGISLSPNPAQSQCIIHNAKFTMEEIDVYNILGESVLNLQTRFTSSFDVSGLSEGIYFVRITGPEFSTTKKLVISR